MGGGGGKWKGDMDNLEIMLERIAIALVYDAESRIYRYVTAHNHDQLFFRTVLESFRYGCGLPHYS